MGYRNGCLGGALDLEPLLFEPGAEFFPGANLLGVDVGNDRFRERRLKVGHRARQLVDVEDHGPTAGIVLWGPVPPGVVGQLLPGFDPLPVGSVEIGL
jgi:hypothetical protein